MYTGEAENRTVMGNCIHAVSCSSPAKWGLQMTHTQNFERDYSRAGGTHGEGDAQSLMGDLGDSD